MRRRQEEKVQGAIRRNNEKKGRVLRENKEREVRVLRENNEKEEKVLKENKESLALLLDANKAELAALVEKQEKADTLEMTITLFFQIQLAMSLRYALSIVGYYGETSGTARLAVGLGVLLLVVNAAHLLRYYLHIRMLTFGVACGPVARIPPERLSRRLKYAAGRRSCAGRATAG